MKRYTYYILTVLLAFVSQAAQAQTEQDALYIYRNDGGFNAFFFDDIDRFEYSCIDTLGVEHEDYVVQEVYALDTLYRIPISAIDSVSFVTPETVYRNDITHTNESDLWNYIVSGDTLQFTLAAQTPQRLIPKVGDKLVRYDVTPNLPVGIFGQVAKVSNASDGTIVDINPLAPQDLMVQYVGKGKLEIYSRDDESSSRAQFGSKEGLTFDDSTHDEDFEEDPFEFSGSLNDFLKLLLMYKSGNVTALATGEGEIYYKASPRTSFRGFYSVGLSGINIAVTKRNETTYKIRTKNKGSLTIRGDIPIIKLKKWIPKTPLIGEVQIGVSGNVSIEGTFEYSQDSKVSCYSSIQYSTRVKEIDAWGYPVYYNVPDLSVNPSTHVLEHASKFAADSKLSGMIGGVATLSAQDLVAAYQKRDVDLESKAFFDVTLRADLGYKVQSDFPLTISRELPNIITDTSTEGYETLSKEGTYSTSWVVTGKLIVKALYVVGKTWTFIDKTLTKSNGSILPPVVNMDAGYSSSSKDLTAKASLSGFTPYFIYPGFALYRKGELMSSYFRPTQYSGSANRPDKNTEHSFKNLEEDLYEVYPAFQFLGGEYLGAPSAVVVVGTPELKPSPSKLNFTSEGETQTIELECKLYNKLDTICGNGYGDWWTCDIVGADLDKYNITVKPNESESERTSHLEFKASVEDTNPLISEKKSVDIYQSGMTQFTVTPTIIDVPGYSQDFQNGNLTKQVTVTYSKSAKSLRLRSHDESWLTADDGGGIGSGSNTCNINIKANTSTKNSRQDTITVELTRADGSIVSKDIIVKQSALSIKVEPKPSEITLQAQAKEGSDVSDTKTVNIVITPYDDFIVSLIKEHSVKPNVEWIKYSQNGTSLQIWAEDNPMEEDRENTLTYTLTLATGETYPCTIKVKQLKKDADPSIIEAGVIYFDATESDKTITIDNPNVEKIENVNPVNGWIGALSSGLELTVTVKENTTPDERRGTLQVIVKMKDDTKATLYYKVVQRAPDAVSPSVAHVYPTSLYFPAKGETQDIKVYYGQYTRSGYSISNDGRDWVSVMNDGEGNMGIRVKPNTTGAERTCTVTVYMTSSTADRPSADEMEAFPITVKQAANALEPGQIAMQSVASFTFTAAALMQDSKTGGTIRKEYTETFSSPNISFTQKGTAVHVQASKNYKDGYDSYQNLIEFDITSFGDNFVRAKIENLSFRHIYQDTYIDFTTPGLYGKSDDVEIELSGIDWQGSLSNYKDDQQSEFVFDGDVKTGVNFKKMTETKLYYSEETPKQYFNYVNSNDNSASLALQFTAKGESLARKQSTQQAAGNVTVGDITW